MKLITQELQIYKMLSLNLPDYPVKITMKNDKKVIFDIVRKAYVALTPEEWVRQHFIHFLIEKKGYPQGLLANEVQLNLNGMKKRCDSVLFDKTLRPRLTIEYKAPTVEITQKVFTQISNYNLVMKVDYLIVSNGLLHYCCKIDYNEQSYHFLEEIPDYSLL